MNVNLRPRIIIGVALGICVAAVALRARLTADPSPSHGEVTPELSRSVGELDLDPAAIETRLKATTRFLASDDLAGRGLSTPQLDLAAEYIAAEFNEMGLRTDHYEGAAFQEFAISQGLTLGSPNTMEVVGPDGARTELSLGEDFTPLSFSRSSRFDLPLVFVGYGITATEAAYDDYEGVDVRGAAAIMLRHEPQQQDAQSPFNGARNSQHAYLAKKVANAVAHGAAAILICTDGHTAGVRSDATSGLVLDVPERLLDFDLRVRNPRRHVPVLHVRRAVVERIMQTATRGSLVDLERQIDRDLVPQSFPLTGWRATGEVTVATKKESLKNVIGVLRGRGALADETIVVGAHYDHLGMGGMGTLAPWTVAVHNGADDNASGTALLIEIARRLSARREPLRRRVIFIAFTAEESGLVGSEHYVGYPLVSLSQTVAMLNMDMVGRLRNERLTVYGTGTAAEFTPLIRRLTTTYDFQLDESPGGYGPSDHASFYARGIPVLHFFTGLHSDYHRPSDDYDKLNYSGMRRIAQLVEDAIIELAQSDSRLRPSASSTSDLFTSSSPVSADPPRPTGLAITVHDVDGSPGCLVSRVTPGGIAHRAGLRVGDVILRWSDSDIHSAEHLSELAAVQRPGETDAVIIRGGLKLELRLRRE